MNKHLIRFAIGAFVVGVIFLFLNTIGCNDERLPTAPDLPDLPALPALPNLPTISPDPTPPPAPPVEPEEPKDARGRIIEAPAYLQCRQSTNYPKDYLTIFRVADSGAQSHYATYGDDPYEHPEGEAPCGSKIQGDCTVRDADPTPGAISAYNLYASFIGVLDCPSEPPCISCGKDDESSDDSSEDSEDSSDDSSDDSSEPNGCVVPKAGSGSFARPLGNPAAECAHFGLVEGFGGFFIMKCGLFYNWGPQIVSPGTCTNGQEISHTTQCICPNEVNGI